MSWPFQNCYWILKLFCISNECCPVISADQTVTHLLQSKRTLQQPGAQPGVGWTSSEVGRAAADPGFVLTAACKEIFIMLCFTGCSNLPKDFSFFSAAFKRGRTVIFSDYFESH